VSSGAPVGSCRWDHRRSAAATLNSLSL
jgi:hypothetical protein